jgi:voltage-gated potassium channel Kch
MPGADQHPLRQAPVVLIGEDRLSTGVAECLRSAGVEVLALGEPPLGDVRTALRDRPSAVLIATLDDIVALRYALVVEYMQPGVRLIVTIFDRTVAGQVRRSVRNCEVLSAAEIAVPSLVGPCVDTDMLALFRTADGLRGVVSDGAGPRLRSAGPVRPSLARRALGWARSQLRPFDVGGRILVGGAVGLLAVLALDTAIALGHGESFVDAWYSAVKVLTTVGPSRLVDHGSEALRATASITILLAAVFFAAFTAGLVQRLLSRRLAGIVGRRTIPRGDHVVVVGLGHFGFRLCLALADLGLRVVAVERDQEAPNVRAAHRSGIPVVIADGRERRVLEQLSLRRARALAAVTSDDLTNVSVSVAALAVREDLRVVLRAFEGAVAQESQALFHIGVVRDVFALASAGLASAALGGSSRVVVADQDTYVIDAQERLRRFPAQHAPAPPGPRAPRGV